MQDHLEEGRMAIALRARLDDGYARALTNDPRGTIERSPWLGQERKAALLARPHHELAAAGVKPCCAPAGASSQACGCPPGVLARTSALDSRRASRALGPSGPFERAIAKVVQRARLDPTFAIAAAGHSGAWIQSARWLPWEELRALMAHPVKRVAGLVASGLSRPTPGATPVAGDLTSVSVDFTLKLQQLIGTVDVETRVGPWTPLPATWPTSGVDCGVATIVGQPPGGLGQYDPAPGYPPAWLQPQGLYGVIGCGHGYSFEHIAANGQARLYLLFGDTVPFAAYDALGFILLPGAPESGLDLSFVTTSTPSYGALCDTTNQTEQFPGQPPNPFGDYTLLVIPDLTGLVLPSWVPLLSATAGGYSQSNHQMGGDEIPYSGISVNGTAFIACHLNHTAPPAGQPNWTVASDFSVLVSYDDVKQRFPLVRTISVPSKQGAPARFLQPAFHAYTVEASAGTNLAPGKYILMWGSSKNAPVGTGVLHMAAIPQKDFGAPDPPTFYLDKIHPDGKTTWVKGRQGHPQSESGFHLSSAQGVLPSGAPVSLHDGTLDHYSIAYYALHNAWLLMYDCRPRAIGGLPQDDCVMLCWSTTPWGPWSAPIVVFQAADGFASLANSTTGFIHQANSDRSKMGAMPDGLIGPFIGPTQPNAGAAFSPMIVERFTTPSGDIFGGVKLTIYFLLSTGLPYYVVLMKTQLAITYAGEPVGRRPPNEGA